MYKYIFLTLSIVIGGCTKKTTSTSNTSTINSYNGSGFVTQGLASVTNNNIYSCAGGRITNIGNITNNNLPVDCFKEKIFYINSYFSPSNIVSGDSVFAGSLTIQNEIGRAHV